MKIQLKRSNVVEGSPTAAKEPTAAQMEYGELAVNYSTQDPAIFLKDSSDQIVRIGGLGAVGYDFLGGEGIDVDISGKDVTFSVDLAGGDDGLEFVGMETHQTNSAHRLRLIQFWAASRLATT